MKRAFLLTLALVVSSAISFVIAQPDGDNDAHTINFTIPEVTLLDIEASASTTITLGVTAPTEAGLPLDFSSATNSDLWLNYTSIKATSTTVRKITVGLDVAPPTNTTLKVSATDPSGTSGFGNQGSTFGTNVTLGTTAVDLITGIGSCYTEDGVNKGSNLTYTLSLTSASSYNDLYSLNQDEPVVVTYTLEDAP